MYIGNLETKQLISIALMIFFAMAAMFFIGYKYAYDQAITYANEQIVEKVNELKTELGIINMKDNPDYILGNRGLSDFGGIEDGKE